MLDTIIIGSGPAGMAASIYAGRAGINAIVIEESPIDGGQVNSTYEVDNYPGLPGVSGMELSDKLSEHAKKAGLERIEAKVTGIECLPEDNGYKVITDAGEYESKTVVLATGARHALLNVPGEEELSGMGVSYCATCDGAFFKNLDVCVVGGSDVAVEDAIYLSKICRKVTLIHRRDTFRAAQSLVDAMEKCDNIEYELNSEVKEIRGEDEVTEVIVFNRMSGGTTILPVSGIFIAVGINPSTELIKDLVSLSDNGYAIAGEDCRTDKKGIYVAGDIRKKPMRQIITAVADGANAINSVLEDIK